MLTVAKIEREAYKLGNALGTAGIPLESPEALRATGDLVVKLAIKAGVEFIIDRMLLGLLIDNDFCGRINPEAQELVRKIRQKVYAEVVRRGIEALEEGSL